MILITRPQPDADLLALLLKRAGHQVLVDSMIRITPIPSKKLAPANTQALILTSQHALHALDTLPYNLPLYVVGERTAQGAREKGFQDVRVGGGSSEKLFDQIRAEGTPDRGQLLYLSGDVIRYDLPAALSSEGFQVERHVVYHTHPATALRSETLKALKSGNIKKVLFFSPRTAEIFGTLVSAAALVNKMRTVEASCLSHAIETAAHFLPWKAITVAHMPTEAELLKAGRISG